MMNTTTEYRDLPLNLLTESTTNPRRVFEDCSLRELADSIRTQGVLSPLLVRPLTEQSFEIVAGARRFRAAQMAEVSTVPVRIVRLSDAEALEAQLIENLQRRDVHPMEEAHGFRALLNLEEPKYSVEQIAAKTGKSPAYIAQRLKLTELIAPVVGAFYAEEIGVGHALLLAKLQPDQQERALAECFREEWAGGGKNATPIMLPVRHLKQWIEHQLLLILKLAPFDKRDAQLVPAAGSCTDCSKRTGHDKLLFMEWREDACTDPTCYASKVEAHIAKTVAAKPELVQISRSYSRREEGSTVLPRNRYTEIRTEKPAGKDEGKRPEFKVCKFTREAIITDGSERGELRKVCNEPSCPVHHPERSTSRNSDDQWKAEQERRRWEEAIANATGIRVLTAIGQAIPVRLLKRDLQFVAEKLAALLDERRLEVLARQHGIKRTKDAEANDKLFIAFARRADEGALGRLLVEATVLLTAARGNATQALRDAAAVYKVDTDAITLKVKQEFADKEKAKTTAKPKSPQKKKAA